MSDLMQPVVDGKVPNSTATTTTKEKPNMRGNSNLGHDAFLQLLVAEMQHQDPLQPTTNTEWISQLATFSQLEELQSLSKTTENSQIFSLVGKNVIVKTEDASGGEVLKSGVVDFISMSGGVAKFSMNGSLYSMDELYSVVDLEYLYDKNKPSVTEEVEFSFDGDEPEDLTFTVDLGADPAEATEVAVLVGNAILDSDYVVLSGNTVTIKKEILQELEEGSYRFSVVFNDERLTTVDNMIKVDIRNSHPTEKPIDPDAPEKPEHPIAPVEPENPENPETPENGEDADNAESGA